MMPEGNASNVRFLKLRMCTHNFWRQRPLDQRPTRQFTLQLDKHLWIGQQEQPWKSKMNPALRFIKQSFGQKRCVEPTSTDDPNSKIFMESLSRRTTRHFREVPIEK